MTKQPECCVCGRPLQPPFHTINGRAYCDEHFAAVNRPNGGAWLAGLAQIVGVAVVCGALAWVAGMLPPMHGAALAAVGVAVALLPSLLWLAFFYAQDRLEPEPKGHIALVFVTALLLTDVVGVRLVRDWFRVGDWAPQSTLTSLLASTLIVGFTYQAIAYMSVRATVYTTPEFDERMDGIVYGTVAGLGCATLLNLRFILESGGAALGPGSIRVATTALAMASFSGLMGYFMAAAKFERRPWWWVSLGVALAAACNGLFSWLISEVSASGLGVAPWRSLLLGLGVALVVFAILIGLMRRVTTVQIGRIGI